ncbi:MAG: rRNA methyltransferase [Bacillales bacterium]|jgi:16S rRNA (cytosine967-C5)-methyltransferase|nr:rRNA methyltransferase [Bacillales bacterium]
MEFLKSFPRKSIGKRILKKQGKLTVREVALDLLEDIEKNNSYSNIALNNAIKENQFSPADSGLLTELVYGTIQRRLTLEYYLNPFIGDKKIEHWVHLLLQMSVYQMVYLDRIPEHAILNEAVEIAKFGGHQGIASFVNGVLRSIQRKGLPSLDLLENPVERLSIEYSHPIWLIEMWVEQFGFESTKEMCEMNLKPPVQTVRINQTKSTQDLALQSLEKDGFTVQKSSLLPECIYNKSGNIAFSAAHRDGFITIQDESSMFVANVVAPEENDIVLDACAAPGGKTTHIAEKMNGQGKVVALDIHKHKIKLVTEAAKRLHLKNIEPFQLDARKISEKFEENTFDKILVDAPCSGLGVLRRKPDAKYTKLKSDIERLSTIQLGILDKVAPFLKPGGKLVYSTCTVNKEENENVVASFLREHADFEPDEDFIQLLPERAREFVKENHLQILPQHFDSDGFFIASFKKKAKSD